MSLKTVLNGLAPVTQIASQELDSSITGSTSWMLARQAVVIGGMAAGTAAHLDGNTTNAAISALLVFGTLGYQVLQKIGSKKEKKALAEAVVNQSIGAVPSGAYIGTTSASNSSSINGL